MPIVEEGRVVGGIGASLFLDQVAEEIGLMLRLRSDREYFALAPNGQTTLHEKAGRGFLDPREQGSATLTNAVNEMLATDAGETTYLFDGLKKKAIYRTSPLTHWTFVITIDATPTS